MVYQQCYLPFITDLILFPLHFFTFVLFKNCVDPFVDTAEHWSIVLELIGSFGRATVLHTLGRLLLSLTKGCSRRNLAIETSVTLRRVLTMRAVVTRDAGLGQLFAMLLPRDLAGALAALLNPNVTERTLLCADFAIT